MTASNVWFSVWLATGHIEAGTLEVGALVAFLSL